MWPVYCVILIFTLALVVPPLWSSGKVYREARVPHNVECPVGDRCAELRFDGIHAVRTNLVSEPARRIETCSLWPEQGDCRQQCLVGLNQSARRA